ncbi:MAG: hypothetical protein M3137_15830 [Actinomycetota bacterium]|nr:hypothetical protein [Actinomycetota bacterium]
MKPLKPLRPWVVPEGWGMVTAGVVGLVYTLVYPEDLGILATFAVWVVAAGGFFVVGAPLTFPEMNAARPVSSDVPVKPSKGPFVHWALMTGGLMRWAVSTCYSPTEPSLRCSRGWPWGPAWATLSGDAGWPPGRTSTESSSGDLGGEPESRAFPCDRDKTRLPPAGA